jgi:hypothetical protein
MDSSRHAGPREAVIELVAEDLRRLICALPAGLKDCVPEQVLLDTGLDRQENDTLHGGR